MKRYAGRVIGKAATGLVKRYTGYGAYSKVGNGGMTGNQTPSIRNGGAEDGCIVISHKEYLGEVKSSTDGNMAVAAYNINPGNENTFPFLSQIARNFQEYRLEGLMFMFRSMYADATAISQTAGTPATNAQGSVIMATQYDPTENPPQTKQELVNLEFAQTAKPSETMSHFVECAKGSSPLTNLYIATSPESQTGDERFYNFGTFNIATLGVPALGATLGELWVSYQVRLYKPKLTLDDSTRDRYFYWGINGTDVATAAAPFGLLDMANAGNQANYCYKGSNYLPVQMAQTKITFPGSRVPKSYLLTWNYIGTAATCTDGNWELNNARFDDQIFAIGGVAGVSHNIHAPNTVSSQRMMFARAITQDKEYLNGQPWTITYDGSLTLPSSITQFRFYVTEIPYYTVINQQ